MTENKNDLEPNGLKQRLAGGIGGVLGVSAGLGVGKLIPFESFWLGVVLVAGCSGIGIFLAQKVARKWTVTDQTKENRTHEEI